MILSVRVARAIVENAFKPLSCRCSYDASSARVRIFDATTGELRLLVAGIDRSGLGTARGVKKLIGELHHELESIQLYHPAEPKQQAQDSWALHRRFSPSELTGQNESLPATAIQGVTEVIHEYRPTRQAPRPTARARTKAESEPYKRA